MPLRNTDVKLIGHRVAAHNHKLQPVASEFSQASGESERVCFASAYKEAIAVSIRRGAPLASYAIDRRSLYNACQGLCDDAVETLICFWRE